MQIVRVTFNRFEADILKVEQQLAIAVAMAMVRDTTQLKNSRLAKDNNALR